ncbi:MAG: hypothetical protein D6820_17275, partial [Lentisphaerae bacterium]
MTQSMRYPIFLTTAMLFLFSQLPAASEVPRHNLLRNGSFEGSNRYWYGLKERKKTIKIVKTDAADGNYALECRSGYIYSGSFKIPPGATVTISCALKAIGPDAKFRGLLCPNSRNAGVPPFRLFWGKSGWGTKVDWKGWRRVSWTVKIPDEKFKWRDHTWWDRKGWFYLPGGNNVMIDSISLTLNGKGKEGYVPYSP